MAPRKMRMNSSATPWMPCRELVGAEAASKPKHKTIEILSSPFYDRQ